MVRYNNNNRVLEQLGGAGSFHLSFHISNVNDTFCS